MAGDQVVEQVRQLRDALSSHHATEWERTVARSAQEADLSEIINACTRDVKELTATVHGLLDAVEALALRTTPAR